MTTNVTEIGGNTHAVSTGTNNYLWHDKNNDQKVNEGDLLVRTAQGDQSTYTHVVGNDEATYAMGDPHLNNKTYTDAEEKQVVKAFSDVFQPGKFVPTQAALANVDNAVTKVGKESNVFDFHASMTLQLTDGTNVRYTTATAPLPKNERTATDGKSKVAYTDSVEIDVTDATGKKRTIQLTEVWADNGGANRSAVREGDRRTARDAAMPKFYEAKGANAMHGVQMFGEDAGTAKNATVVSNDGKVDVTKGKSDPASVKFYDNLVRSNHAECLRYVLTLGDSRKEDEEAQRLIRAAQLKIPASESATPKL